MSVLLLNHVASIDGRNHRVRATEKATDSARRARRGRIICFWICVLIVIVIALAVGLPIGLKAANKNN